MIYSADKNQTVATVVRRQESRGEQCHRSSDHQSAPLPSCHAAMLLPQEEEEQPEEADGATQPSAPTELLSQGLQ